MCVVEVDLLVQILFTLLALFKWVHTGSLSTFYKRYISD